MHRSFTVSRQPAARVALGMCVILGGLAWHGARADDAPVATVLAGLPARSIGPANMSGRVTDVSVVEPDGKVWYVATANGGVWKTTDGGDKFSAVFDNQSTLCVGAVAVAPSDPNVVYVGTGEANPRNSVSWGHGIFRSKDGGTTWSAPALPESHHIGRIVVHPTNPDVAYAAVLGHFWAPNKERGLYKTVNGGQSWMMSKHIDENTGFVDVQMDPSDPDTLYAAAYPVRRDSFSGGAPRTQWGPNGGLYKTTDGGVTWEKMTNGLPDRAYGRCALSIYRKDPKIVFALVQTDRTDDPTGNRGQTARTNEGNVEKGGIFRSEDKGASWKKINDLVPRPFYYGQIRVDPTNEKYVYVLGVAFHWSEDGGKTFNSGRTTHADHHAMWISPKDSNVMVVGNDGGVCRSNDAGETWEGLRGMALGQFYGVAVDMRTPYRVYGGLQDNGSWGGPSATDRPEGITLADWRQVGGGDGFRAAVDPTDPNTVYVESQGGALQRINPQAAGRRGVGGRGAGGGKADDKGKARDAEKAGADKAGADNAGADKAGADKAGADKAGADKAGADKAGADKAGAGKAGAGQGKGGARGGAGGGQTGKRPRPERDGPAYRFNWNSPLLLSPHDPKTVYFGGNFLFRSNDRADTWKRLGPDLTRGAEGRSAGHTLTTIAESPLKAGLLYVGADDGKVQVSRDGGENWTDLSEKIPGVPQDRWITSIECSHAAEGTAYLTIDRHRNDDLKPYLFKTTDYGETWVSLTDGLPPRTPVHVVRESSKNANLLFAGTEHGLFVSIDGGRRWHRAATSLPPAVTVHDLVIHPRDRELVIGTHGRSVYVMDVAPLEELTPAVLAGPAHLFAVKPVPAVPPREVKPSTGRAYVAPNPSQGAKIVYWLGGSSTGPVGLTVTDASGKTVATWDRPGTPGFHEVIWNLRPAGGDGVAAPGDYKVTLKIPSGSKVQTLKLNPGPKPAEASGG